MALKYASRDLLVKKVNFLRKVKRLYAKVVRAYDGINVDEGIQARRQLSKVLEKGEPGSKAKVTV